MGKTNRGKNIKKTPGWRGKCPICNRTGVKLMWTNADGQKVCKICGSK